jgi:hypothetical protein
MSAWRRVGTERRLNKAQIEHRAAVSGALPDLVAMWLHHKRCLVGANASADMVANMAPSQQAGFERLKELCSDGMWPKPERIRDTAGYRGDPSALIRAAQGGGGQVAAEERAHILALIRETGSPQLLAGVITALIPPDVLRDNGFEPGTRGVGLDQLLIELAAQLQACRANNSCAEAAGEQIHCVLAPTGACLDSLEQAFDQHFLARAQQHPAGFARVHGATPEQLRSRWERAQRFVQTLLAGQG